MKIVYKKYTASDEIPVYDYVHQRKLVKYYTRETMAAVVAAAELLAGCEVRNDMPFFYSTGETEVMEFYTGSCKTYAIRNTTFNTPRFIEYVVIANAIFLKKPFIVTTRDNGFISYV